MARIALANLRMAGLDVPAREWEAAGHEVAWIKAPPAPAIEYAVEDLARLTGAADVLVNDGRQYVSDAIMDAIPSLRAIAVPFIGVDKIDVAAATARNLIVANSPSEPLLHAVAEATILLMLALNKRLRHEENLLAQGKVGTPEDRNDQFMGKIVGIVGLGRTGKQIAVRLQGWGVRILAYDPYLSEVPESLRGFVELSDLDSLLRESDFVAAQAVLTSETYHMIGERELHLMKPTAYVVNTARGAIIDEEALVEAVNTGTIAGAGLDTFETEPLPMSSRLRELDPEKVILTPHILPHSHEAIAGNMALLTRNVLNLATGRVPEQLVNPGVIPAWQKRFASAVQTPSS